MKTITPLVALAEDLRRFGLILIAAGVVSGFLQERFSLVTALCAALAGVCFNLIGYWLHSRERNP